jgi:electron transport complex protein RnfA
MYEYFLIALVAIFVNNIVFAQFFGMCPFIGVSKKTSIALGMGLAVTFVITISSICS